MSIATGRTPKAIDLLNLPNDVEVAIPVVCFMEAHEAFKSMKAAKLDLTYPFPGEISDVGRDPDVHAQEFARMLAAADRALTEYLAQSERRLNDAIHCLSSRARLVSSSPAVLQRAIHRYLSDATDDMIAASVIEDATESPISRMAFFSEDEKLKQPSLVEAMRNVGITMPSGVDRCLEWCVA
jgi:hypothetical protein